MVFGNALQYIIQTTCLINAILNYHTFVSMKLLCIIKRGIIKPILQNEYNSCTLTSGICISFVGFNVLTFKYCGSNCFTLHHIFTLFQTYKDSSMYTRNHNLQYCLWPVHKDIYCKWVLI